MERIKPAEPVHFIDRESRQRDMGKRRSRFQVFLEIEMGKIKMARKITKEVALKEIRKAAIEQYGCLIPDGNVNVSLELPWTREPFLGSLRRQGMIQQWKQTDKEIAQTNLRHYEVVIDSKYLR